MYPAARQRRLTDFFRLLLLVPQFIVLVLGRLPEWAADYLSGWQA